jgi:hypothetical protein
MKHNTTNTEIKQYHNYIIYENIKKYKKEKQKSEFCYNRISL